MERTFSDCSVGGAISIGHLTLTPEEMGAIDRLIAQAMTAEDDGDFYGEGYKAPEWFGRQHGCEPVSYPVAQPEEPRKGQGPQQSYNIAPKDDLQPVVPSNSPVFGIRVLKKDC